MGFEWLVPVASFGGVGLTRIPMLIRASQRHRQPSADQLDRPRLLPCLVVGRLVLIRTATRLAIVPGGRRILRVVALLGIGLRGWGIVTGRLVLHL